MGADVTALARRQVSDPSLRRPDWTAGIARDRRLLWLDKNENTDPELAEVTRDVLASLSAEALYTYPECTPLYRKLAEHVGIEMDHLLLAAGSDGVIRSVFEAFVEPGDVVMHTVPTFAMYTVYTRMYGALPVTLEYEASGEGPRLAVNQVVAAIRKARPKAVCLPNPDSPTGTVFPPEELRRIVDAAGAAGAVMLIDEAYHPFYDGTAVPWVAECPHLVIARTFAKAWGLAGLRIGYAVASPEVAKLLHKVRPMYEVNTVAVLAMERMLDHEGAMLASVRRLNEGKAAFLTAMEAMRLRILRGYGNFLHVAFGAYAPVVHAALADLVLYRRDFAEPCLQGFSRFSSATARQFEPVVRRIAEAVRGVR